MYMSSSANVLKLVTVASIVTIAAFALALTVSIGLGHAQTMRETASLSGMGNHHMNYANSTRCDDNMSTHMNAAQHMGGSPYSGHEGMHGMHNQLNMTEHMQDMHYGNITASHMENNFGGCHD